LNTSASRIHHTIDVLVPIAEISYLESKKINNPFGNLIPKNGIRKKGIGPSFGNKPSGSTVQFLFWFKSLNQKTRALGLGCHTILDALAIHREKSAFINQERASPLKAHASRLLTYISFLGL
jgi:hypothetical protein